MSQEIPVITIDGPSGSGKGTLGKMLSSTLGWHYLDSGALYRILAFAALEKQLSLEEIPAICDLAISLPIRFFNEGEHYHVMLADQDIADQLAGEDVGHAASTIAANQEIRDALLERQRNFRQLPGLVTDGRDMGTVVFPDATVKIFLDATLERRSDRRYKQLQEKGIDANLQKVFEDLKQRDIRDSERAVAPLKPASDAILFDSTELRIREVFEQVLSLVKAKVGSDKTG